MKLRSINPLAAKGVRPAWRPAPMLKILGIAPVVVLAACASVPAPNEELAVAQAAVTSASSASTRESAGAELQIAVSKLDRARAALASGEPETAKRLAEEATLDAQVADLHAQAIRARKSAQESEDAGRALREEINRKAPR